MNSPEPMNLESCLPSTLQGSSMTITRVAAGLSGAGVYRVDTADGVFVLKIAGAEQPLADWQRKLRLQTLASDAGLAPRIVHVDEARRAIVSEFVVDKSFPALLFNPATRDAALDLLGGTLRRLHDLPLPDDIPFNDPKDYLIETWSHVDGRFAMPAFVAEAVRKVLAEPSRMPHGAQVLSHNDVNPSNLVYDGEGLKLLDWDTSGANDPFYDLAAIAVFLRMDDATCKRLLSAHESATVDVVPERFTACRRMAAVLCGVMFMRLAQFSGHGGAKGTETLESTPSLGDFYQKLRSGGIDIASGDGQWMFGLALIKQVM